jgi:hypothetical protein
MKTDKLLYSSKISSTANAINIDMGNNDSEIDVHLESCVEFDRGRRK